MAEFFSDTAYKRLPTAIKDMPEQERDVFIMLRMRRAESFIALRLGISLSLTREMVGRVQETLIKSGSLDLIQDPVFYQLDHPRIDNELDSRPLELSSREMDVADRLELERFYGALGKSIGQLPKRSRRLLSLWYNKEMTAKEILNFYKKLGVCVKEGKPIGQTTVQDIFYVLEKNIQNLLEIVRTNLKQDGIELTRPALKAILNETGV
ncbi:hypothetical protein MNBD_NITROSPINAE04-2703 [hydrothermal vent metagenome]|uniref:RNA polymerase sigma-70 region 4 domain-containing protein n=1 Tax=hydrothermal vent metagenome TaxID=652676 RepID=A0A3B1BWU5_9ZZZZ